MFVHIRNVLSADQVAQCRQALESADWADGRATAGYLSQRVKNNVQLPEHHPVARRLGDMILDALDANQTFVSAALPLKIVPPLFNRYSGTQSYGPHIDGAVRPVPGTPHRVRTDLSATLFLTPPDSYEGGELVIGETGQRVKLPAGDLVLYGGTHVHHVEPVNSGVRLASFFWIQSMVRDAGRRAVLYDLDTAIQALGADLSGHDAVVKLAGVYHNLLRQWADT